jgi:hypothetical protein
MIRNFNSLFLVVFLCSFFLQSCEETKTELSKQHETHLPFIPEAKAITELLPGDILVRPNLNFLPGTSVVSGRGDFGHAAIVVKGSKHSSIDSLLARASIVEAIARDVPPAFQVREIAAFKQSNIIAFNNISFGRNHAGNRYLLRLNLPQSAIDSIVAFALDQKGDLYSWTSPKRFSDDPVADSLAKSGIIKSWADNSAWYCSLLVWQSVYYVTGIDLDANGGYRVYPNDLIKSKYFDGLLNGQQKRVRF